MMTSKIKMTTTAAEQVAGNRYLLEEILIRLPPKPVTRSKLVSKQWLPQISDPEFVHRHSQHGSPNKCHTGMFVTDRVFISRKFEFDFVSFNALDPTYQTIPSLGFLFDVIGHRRSEIEIIDSCNGLFLCSVRYSGVYCVCNPTTKTFRLLNLFDDPFNYEDRQICTGYLAFNPSVSPHYKVISIRRLLLSYELDIYSSEDGLWKRFDPPIDQTSGQGFFLNDSVYWLSDERSFRFDVNNKEMKPLDFLLPRSPKPCFWENLYAVGSRLYYVERKCDGEETPDFCAVEVSSDLSKWVTKYDGSFCPLLSSFPDIVNFEPQYELIRKYCFSALCLVEGVKADELQLVLRIPDKVILYNLEEKTAEELYGLHSELGYNYSSVRVFQFIETLAFV